MNACLDKTFFIRNRQEISLCIQVLKNETHILILMNYQGYEFQLHGLNQAMTTKTDGIHI